MARKVKRDGDEKVHNAANDLNFIRRNQRLSSGESLEEGKNHNAANDLNCTHKKAFRLPANKWNSPEESSTRGKYPLYL